jgi:hypothetical protein
MGCLICIWAFASWHPTARTPTKYTTTDGFNCFIEVPWTEGIHPAPLRPIAPRFAFTSVFARCLLSPSLFSRASALRTPTKARFWQRNFLSRNLFVAAVRSSMNLYPDSVFVSANSSLAMHSSRRTRILPRSCSMSPQRWFTTHR